MFKEPVTEEELLEHARNAARDHVAYGWSRTPGSCSGRVEWTEAMRAAYHEAYTAAERIYYPYRFDPDGTRRPVGPGYFGDSLD